MIPCSVEVDHPISMGLLGGDGKIHSFILVLTIQQHRQRPLNWYLQFRKSIPAMNITRETSPVPASLVHAVLRTNHNGCSADISAKYWATRCQPVSISSRPTWPKSVSGPTALSARNLLKITIIATASPDLVTVRHSPHRGLRAPLVPVEPRIRMN